MTIGLLVALVQVVLIAGPGALQKLKADHPELAAAIDQILAALASLPDPSTLPAAFWSDISQLAATFTGPVGHDPTEGV